MKVEFVWSVATEAEIPDNEIISAISDSELSYLDKGANLAKLANKYNALPTEDGEITAALEVNSTDIIPIWEN